METKSCTNKFCPKKVLEGFNLLEYGDRGKRKECASVLLAYSGNKRSSSKLLRKWRLRKWNYVQDKTWKYYLKKTFVHDGEPIKVSIMSSWDIGRNIQAEHPGFASNSCWLSWALFAAWSVRHVRCMGRRNRAFAIRIVARMVGKITPTGFRHLEMGYEYIQGTGARSGQNPAACPCILPLNFERLSVGGKYRFYIRVQPDRDGPWLAGGQ